MTKEAAEAVKELEELRGEREKANAELGELREYVDSASSFESMVEEMSGKNLALEDEVKALVAANNELEEALELATEMEEVQAEELKAAMLEQQSGQTMVQNLQEAIRMQVRNMERSVFTGHRRLALERSVRAAANSAAVSNASFARPQREKENEFDGTVAKYKALVADLKAERDGLIASNSEALGDQGALIQKSQQVLAKAAKEAKVLEDVRRKEQVRSRITGYQLRAPASNIIYKHLPLRDSLRSSQQMKKMRMDQPISEMQIATFKAFLPSEVSGLFTSALAGDVTLQVVCGTCALGLEDLFRLWDTARDEEVSVDTKAAMTACEGDCVAGESFVNASMESYRVMLALGMGAIENVTEDELVEVRVLLRIRRRLASLVASLVTNTVNVTNTSSFATRFARRRSAQSPVATSARLGG